jgi:hypothetical protein
MSSLTRRGARITGTSLLLVLITSVAGLTVLKAGRTRPVPLGLSAASSQALGEMVLAAVRAGDLATLDAMALTEDEFRQYVWPDLPVSRPEADFPFTFVWGRLHEQSDRYLRHTVAELAGHDVELIRVEFAGASTEYEGARVHRDTVLIVRDATKTERPLRLFGSTFEQNGRYKVFSYVVGD